MRIAILADPLEQFKIYKDTTYAIMREAQSRSHEIHVLGLSDLACESGSVVAHTQRIHLTFEKEVSWYRAEPALIQPLKTFDVVLMRKDPPFDMEYVYATYLLEQAEREGANVLNRPRAIRDHSEKCAILEFPEWTEATLVTRNMKTLHTFIEQHIDCILKPLDGMGGESIFRIQQSDLNRNVIVETLTQRGSCTVMIQRYIPEIKEGDKRILLIGGTVVPYALARIPAKGETRGNLAAGGRGEARELTKHDQKIADKFAPLLWSRGLFLVGLDVIGDYLTEINVTSPTCFQEIEAQTGCNVAGLFLDQLEKVQN